MTLEPGQVCPMTHMHGDEASKICVCGDRRVSENALDNAKSAMHLVPATAAYASQIASKGYWKLLFPSQPD